MIDRSAPVLVHPWIGPLYRNGDHELVGSMDLDPTVRRARSNGGLDVEVLLEVDDLPTHKHYVLEHAPPDWVLHYGAQLRLPLIDRLFLEDSKSARSYAYPWPSTSVTWT